MEKAVYYSQHPSAQQALEHLPKQISDKFEQEGLDCCLAEDRARDFDVLYVFEGKQVPLRQ